MKTGDVIKLALLSRPVTHKWDSVKKEWVKV
jgi:hypothetical protein